MKERREAFRVLLSWSWHCGPTRTTRSTGAPPPNTCWVCRIDSDAEAAGTGVNTDRISGDDICRTLKSQRRRYRRRLKGEGDDRAERRGAELVHLSPPTRTVGSRKRIKRRRQDIGFSFSPMAATP